MDFFDLVKCRRSVRKFKSIPVSKEDVLKVLDAANWAPSAMNSQPWEFIVITGERINQLGNSYMNAINRLRSKMTNPNDDKIIFSDEFAEYAKKYGGAPVVIVVLVKASKDPSAQRALLASASAAMENLVLAAADLGLGTCWMTGPLRDESNLRNILNISDDMDLVAITPLGYAQAIPNLVPRKDPNLEQKIIWLE